MEATSESGLHRLKYGKVKLQCKIKRCSLLYRAFGPNPAAVAVNDALHGGQANTGARKFSHAMQTLERSEKFVRVGHVEAGAVVAHKVGMFAFELCRAEFDARLSAFARKLPRTTKI